MSSSCPRSNRRYRLRTLALACMLGLSGADAGAQTLKLATLVPEGSLWDKAVRGLGATIQGETQGRVRFQIYPGGVAGDEPDILRKLKIGQLHAALFSAPGLGDIDPAFYAFEVPLLFESDAEVRAVLEALRPVFAQRLEQKGFVLLHWGDAGWMRFFASRPMRDFEEFRTLKQFVWGSETSMARWYQELGLRPVVLSATDVLTGLQTGLIEAFPATPLAALSLQWFRSAPYMLDHRFAPLLGALVVTRSAWGKLADEDRQRLQALALETERELFEQVPLQEARALAEMQARGLTIVREPPADGEKWLELGRQFQQRFRAKTVPPEVFDQMLGILEQERQRR